MDKWTRSILEAVDARKTELDHLLGLSTLPPTWLPPDEATWNALKLRLDDAAARCRASILARGEVRKSMSHHNFPPMPA